jgi:photosystem II stability/assembly factor-like uncharacterized protein
MRLHGTTGDAVFTLERGSRAWSARLALEGSGAQCLAVDPREQDTLYAGSPRQGLFKTGDGGRSWERLDLPHEAVFSVAVSAVDGAVYAGCEPSMIFRSSDGGASWRELSSLRSLPSAPTWSFPPRPWTSHVRWLAPSPHDASLLLAGIELGGVMRSADGGETWADHRPGAQPDVHSLAWHPSAAGRAYEAGGGGAAWSRDGGDTWEPADRGRDLHYTWALAVDGSDPDRWYVSASPGPQYAHRPGQARGKLYRWQADEGRWQTLGGGLPQPLGNMVYALASGPGWLFAGLIDGEIYASRDSGDSWNRLPMGADHRLPGITALVISEAAA